MLRLMLFTEMLVKYFKSGALLPYLIIVIIALFCIEGAVGLKADLGGDATQNFLSSYNFFANGEYGHDIGSAGLRREPLPNWILGTFLFLFVRPPRDLTKLEVLASQDILDSAVCINIVWAACLFLFLWLLCRQIFDNKILADCAAINSIVVSNAVFVRLEFPNLNTELPAAVLICLLAIVFVQTLKSRSWMWAGASGVTYGLLVLVKASGAYVAFFTMPFVAVCIAFAPKLKIKIIFTSALKYILLIALGFSLIVLPWIYRNYYEFGDPKIAEGGGRVLWIRSEFNKINKEQYLGAFYAYSPRLLQQSFWEPVFGYKSSQLECGGNLQLHKRGLSCDIELRSQKRYEDVVSLYERGKKALPQKMYAESKQKNIPFNVDSAGKDIFFEGVKQSPLRHVLLTIPLAWRGIWSFAAPDYFGLFVNFIFMGSLIVMPLIALLLRDNILFLISIVPASYFWFYAFLSQFWERFSEPFIPISVVSFTLLIVSMFNSSHKAKMIVARHNSTDD